MGQVTKSSDRKEFLYVCCVCGNARDDIARDGFWQSLEAHLTRYSLNKSDFLISHTICPRCFLYYKDSIGLDPSGKNLGK